MTHLTTRPAELDDIAIINDIYNEAIEEGGLCADLEPQSLEHKIDWWQQLTVQGYPVQVILHYSVVIGYFYFSPWRGGRMALTSVAEFSIYIRQDYRDQHVASSLYPCIMDLARSSGYKHLLAILLDVNARSRKSLEKGGFRLVGHLEDIADIGLSVCGQWLMQCDL